MTKKAASKKYPKLSDYLTAKENDNLNIRGTVKAVREAFQSGELNIFQTADILKIEQGKGLVKGTAGDRAIIYDFLILDEEEFETWLSKNKSKLLKKDANGEMAKLSAEDAIAMMENDPEGFRKFQEDQRNSIKIYPGGTPDKAMFADVQSAMDAGEYHLALSKLKEIKSRGANSKRAIDKENYRVQIEALMKQENAED